MRKKIGITLIAVLFITIGIQGVSLLKNVMLTKQLGASQTLDSFFLSNIYTVSIFNVISASITTVMIPEYSHVTLSNNKNKKYIEQYFTIINLFTLFLIIISMIVLYSGVNVFTPKFSIANQELFLKSTLILFIGQLFRVQTSFSTAVLQIKEQFVLPKIANLVSVCMPIIYMFYSKKLNILIMVFFITLGYFLEMLILSIYQYSKKDQRLFLNINKPEIKCKTMLMDTIPIILSSMVFQIQLLFSNYMVGYFGEGYITIFSNTSQIVGMFQILFVSNIISIMYPKIVSDVKTNITSSLSSLTRYIISTNALIILLVWGYISLGEDLITILLVRGNFSSEDGKIVYLLGIFLILSLPISVIRDYCYRLFYSLNLLKYPTINSLKTVVLNILLILLLSPFIGIYSVAVGPMIGTLTSTLSIIKSLNKIGYEIDNHKIIKYMLVFNFYGIIMFLSFHYLKITLFSPIINFILNMVIGTIIYSLPTYFTLRKERIEYDK